MASIVKSLPRPVKQYRIEPGNRARFRSPTLGNSNNATMRELAKQLGGRKDLIVYAYANGCVCVRTTWGDATEDAEVPTIFLVPNDLSERDELEADAAIGGKTELYHILPASVVA